MFSACLNQEKPKGNYFRNANAAGFIRGKFITPTVRNGKAKLVRMARAPKSELI
jgi:hypothetical protein